MKIALDVMGGDHAPESTIHGLKLALMDFPDVDTFLLVGDEQRITAEMGEAALIAAGDRIEIVHAPQVIEMHDPAKAALRGKKNSSITVAATLLKEGKADALVSAGHTGATVACAILKVRMMPHIERPAIATVLPGPEGLVVLLDVGAHVDQKPLHLAHYAIMGEAYARHILQVEKPRVGLLNVGTEDSKGNELTHKTFPIIENLPIDFIGNVEGRDLFNNSVDVVVCDGFVGNTILKALESLAHAFGKMLKSHLRKNPVRMAGALLSKKAFSEIRDLTDHEEYGGAPLLGIDGICIIGHGSSSPKAIRNGLRVAREMAKTKLNQHIADTVAAVDWDHLLIGTPEAVAAPAASSDSSVPISQDAAS